MKKIFISLLFISSFIYAQNNEPITELYCYELSELEVEDFIINVDHYKNLIRDILKKENADKFSIFFQNPKGFAVICIGINVEKDYYFHYDFENKTLEILYSDDSLIMQENLISDVSIIQTKNSIILNKISLKFIINRIDNLFIEMGIKSMPRV